MSSQLLQFINKFNWKEQNSRFCQLTLRMRLMVFLLIAIVIVMLWALIFVLPLRIQLRDMATNVIDLQNRTITLGNETKNIISQAGSSDAKLGEKHQALQKRIDALNRDMALYSNETFYPKNIDVVLPNLVDQQTGLKLINFHADPVEVIKKKDESGHALYLHNFVIEFSGDYFSTVDYLKKLEKMRWRLFWDKLNYKVTKYPNAQIIVGMHVISVSDAAGGENSG